MTLQELDAVMAHEIGHVKRFHLPLYVLLIGGFMISIGYVAEPLYTLMLSKDAFYSFVNFSGVSLDTVRNIVITIPLLAVLLLYFRFVFSFFMRNFERQADLHVFPVLGGSAGIISAFEKIAILSGNIRDEPSWHHFGIGQRVDYLHSCEEDQSRIQRHHHKIVISLGLYVMVLAAALFLIRQLPLEEARTLFEYKYTRAELLHSAQQEENPAHWLLFAANYFSEHQLEDRSLIAIELALQMEPAQPEILNNYAWLLLTSRDKSLRNPQKALDLARTAAALQPRGHILDTLATAWWANGFVDEALETIQQALFIDPEQSGYYLSQLERFRKLTYVEED
jgi:hypothetical protein